MPLGNKNIQQGFTYILALFMVFMLSLATLKLSVVWQAQSQRQKEIELLGIGQEFRLAIGRYYEASPGTLKKYPRSFNDLLADQRFLSTTRHLRRVYLDPMTGQPNWGLVPSPDGGIMGVYSLSTAVPYKRHGFRKSNELFALATTYADWKFSYIPPVGAPGQLPAKRGQ
jgi:type II secretory pathway pseudopilin PulG